MKLADMIKLGMNGFKPADIKQLTGSGVSTDEIISLAKNGYSVTDINELITLSGQAEEVQPGNDGHSEPQGPADLPGNEGAKVEADYIERINTQEQELAKLRSTLEAVQNQNAARDLGGAGPEDPREKLQAIFKGIY